MIPGVVIPVWREYRYLPLILEQAQLCPGRIVVLWQDHPLWWYGEGEPPTGHDSKVKDVLDQFRGLDVVKLNRAPEGPAHGGYPELLRMGFRILQSHKTEVVVLMDSDWILTIDDTLKLFESVTQAPTPAFFSTNARHYWRNWDTTFARTGITFGFPVHLSEEIFAAKRSLETVLVDVMCHHPAYVMPDDEMYEKVHAFGHADYYAKRGFWKNEWLPRNDAAQNLQPRDVSLPESIVSRLRRWKAWLDA